MRKLLTFLIASIFSIAVSASSFGGSMMLLGVGGPAAAAGFSLTFKDSNSSATNATTIDFGTRTYGSGCTRVVVGNIWLPPSGAHTITGITVGGTSLAQVTGAYKNQFGSSGIALDVWESSAALAGTSGDVQVTYSATTGGGGEGIAVYCLVTTSPTAGTPVTNGVNCCGSTSITATGVVVPSGGGALVLVGAQNGTTITGYTNAAQDADVVTPPFSNNTYYAHTTATGTINVTANFSGSDGPAISVVPWGP